LQGYHLIIPTLSENDIRTQFDKYFENNKQVIFHNLGTGIAALNKQELIFIQQVLDDLSNININIGDPFVFQYVSKFSESQIIANISPVIPKNIELNIEKEIELFSKKTGFLGQQNKFVNLLNQFKLFIYTVYRFT